MSCPEILPIPLLDRILRFEVAEILEIETLVLAVELSRTLFTPVNDLVDISVDGEADYLCKVNILVSPVEGCILLQMLHLAC